MVLTGTCALSLGVSKNKIKGKVVLIQASLRSLSEGRYLCTSQQILSPRYALWQYMILLATKYLCACWVPLNIRVQLLWAQKLITNIHIRVGP